ncbi:MAG TPA: NAD-binding protein [Acetobacteraceae bacterium]|nr:NAD-binding protein [Acetobacteraceae bacterium]
MVPSRPNGRRATGLPRAQPAPRLPAGALGSPIRNLARGAAFVTLVVALAILGYTLSGWSVGDALYMAVLTVFTVGYDEVRPIDTPALRAITIGLIGFGCTGMLFVTGALVQLFTAAQFREILDERRVTSRIEDLRGHVIVCGFGRIGNMLARELAAAGAGLIVLERSEPRCAEAQRAGYLCLCADATDEDVLQRAGIGRARALATVLPDDAANVFITLSARSLNRALTIISRGEAPSTERKLLHAGADRVVMPAHIGAERIAELLLFPDSAEALRGPRALEAELSRMGLEFEVVVVEPGSVWAGMPVAAIEAAAASAFLIVAIEHAGSAVRQRPEPEAVVRPGDGVTVLGRNARAALAGFSRPPA